MNNDDNKKLKSIMFLNKLYGYGSVNINHSFKVVRTEEDDKTKRGFLYIDTDSIHCELKPNDVICKFCLFFSFKHKEI